MHAQSTDATATGAIDSTEMQKVVVTARRREETLQDVPVSVTAISADQLSKQGIPDVTALALQLPNTTYFNDVKPSSPTGPRACSLSLEMPISAPRPYSNPSAKKVGVLSITELESTSAYKGIPLAATTAVALAEHHDRDLPWCLTARKPRLTAKAAAWLARRWKAIS